MSQLFFQFMVLGFLVRIKIGSSNSRNSVINNINSTNINATHTEKLKGEKYVLVLFVLDEAPSHVM